MERRMPTAGQSDAGVCAPRDVNRRIAAFGLNHVGPTTEGKPMTSTTRSGLLLPVSCIALLSIASAQVTIVPDRARTVYVTGRGVLSVTPDTATVTLGVFARDADLKKAKGAVDSAIQRVIAVGERLQLKAGDLKTSSVNVSPQYAD